MNNASCNMYLRYRKTAMNISNIIVNLTTITYVYITAIIEELLVLKMDLLYFKIKF